MYLLRMTLRSLSASRPNMCRSRGPTLSCLPGVSARCFQRRLLGRLEV